MTRMVLTLPADGQTYQRLHPAPPPTTPDQPAERANEHYTRKPDGGGLHRRGKRRRNRHATGQNSHPTIPHEPFKLLTGLEKTGKHNKKREKIVADIKLRPHQAEAVDTIIRALEHHTAGSQPKRRGRGAPRRGRRGRAGAPRPAMTWNLASATGTPFPHLNGQGSAFKIRPQPRKATRTSGTGYGQVAAAALVREQVPAPDRRGEVFGTRSSPR